MNKLDQFMMIYREELENAVREYPNEYAYSIDRVPEVFAKMKTAMLRSSFNKDSRAIKATCKRLSVPHTYKALNEIFRCEHTEVRP